MSKNLENRATSGDCRPMSAPILADFMVGRRVFCRSTKLKVSLTDPPIFRGFVIGEASGDGRPMIGRQSADYLKKFSSCYRPDHRASIGRRSPDGRSMTYYQRTVGRQTLDIGRQSADDRPTVDRS